MTPARAAAERAVITAARQVELAVQYGVRPGAAHAGLTAALSARADVRWTEFLTAAAVSRDLAAAVTS